MATKRTGYISVKNFERFQHYKDRNPLWIKLYYELLDDYEFAGLPDASKMHLIGIWMLASRNENRIPNDAAWIAQRIGARSRVDIKLLADAGFLLLSANGEAVEQSASNVPADCEQNATPYKEERYTEEKEKETDTVEAVFEQAKLRYPRRSGVSWPDAKKQWRKRIKEGHSPKALLDGTERYAEHCKAEGTDPRFIKMPSTFFGPGLHFLSEYESGPNGNGGKSDPEQEWLDKIAADIV